MKKRIKKTLSRRKKLRRLVLWAVVFFPSAILIGLAVFRLLLPEDKLRSMVSQKLSASMDRPVGVEKMSIHPFGRLDIRGVTVGFREEERVAEGAFFEVERMRMAFRLLPLLRRRLEVTSVLIEGPRLHLVPVPSEKVGREKSMIGEESVARTRPFPKSLPFSFGLFRLVMKNFRFALTMPDSLGGGEVVLEGGCLEVSDIRLPRDYREAPGEVSGKVRLFTQDGTLVLKERGTVFRVGAHLDVEGEWSRGGRWHLDGSLGIGTLGDRRGPDACLALGLEGIGYGERIRVDTLDISVGDQSVLRVEGELEHLGPEATVDFAVGSDELDLRKISASLQRFLPNPWMEPLNRVRLNGLYRLEKGKVWGTPEDLQFRYRSTLREGDVEYPDEGWRVSDGDFVLEAGGSWKEPGVEGGRMLGKLGVGSISYAMDDTVSFSMRDVSLRWDSELDSGFIPEKGCISGGVEDVLGGSLGLDFQWDSDGGRGKTVEKLVARGKIQGDSLRFENLPTEGSALSGILNLAGTVEAKGVGSINVDLEAFSPGLSYELEEREETTPALRMTTRMSLRTDSRFREWILDSARVRLNDLLWARLEGVFAGPEGRFCQALTDGEVRNEGVSDFFPMSSRRQLEGTALWGKEVMTAEIEGQRWEDSTAVSVSGKLQLVDGGMVYPGQMIRVVGTEGAVAFGGTAERIEGEGNVHLGDVFLTRMRPDPIPGGRLHFRWGMVPGDSLWVDGGEVCVEEMGDEGMFRFWMGQGGGSRKLAAQAEMRFRSEDAVEVAQGVSVEGDVVCRVEAKSIDRDSARVRFEGELGIDTMVVDKGRQFALRGIRGRIPFRFDADPAQKRLLPDSTSRFLVWTEYESQRVVYQHLSPVVGNLRVEEIEMTGYRMTDLVMDLDLLRGGVHIPWFSVNVLGGNFGGSLFVNPGTGAKGDVTYEIRAQASRINSAALTDGERKEGEETELNATLAFRGRGIDLDRGVDLEGFFHITKIGPKFASTLLVGMDPQGADRSIRLTRRLLNTGWKPKLFSFELRHGHVYPSLALSQPWFSPIRIPGQLEYGRLPLEFFLKPRKHSE